MSPPSGSLPQLVWLHLVILLHTRFLVFLLLYSIEGINLHKIMTRSETSKTITHLQSSYSAAPQRNCTSTSHMMGLGLGFRVFSDPPDMNEGAQTLKSLWVTNTCLQSYLDPRPKSNCHPGCLLLKAKDSSCYSPTQHPQPPPQERKTKQNDKDDRNKGHTHLPPYY